MTLAYDPRQDKRLWELLLPQTIEYYMAYDPMEEPAEDENQSNYLDARYFQVITGMINDTYMVASCDEYAHNRLFGGYSMSPHYYGFDIGGHPSYMVVSRQGKLYEFHVRFGRYFIAPPFFPYEQYLFDRLYMLWRWDARFIPLLKEDSECQN